MGAEGLLGLTQLSIQHSIADIYTSCSGCRGLPLPVGGLSHLPSITVQGQ